MNSLECGTNTDHVVVVIGYGIEDGQDYFLLRNSHGENWGEEGYMRIATSSEGGPGICGV